MNIIKAIIAINPNANVLIEDNDVDQITWLNGTEVISKSDIETKLAELQSAFDAKEYQRDRAAAFKQIKEQLDLLYKDMLADKGDKTGEWFKHIKAVKDANPKD